jgi:SAM-dependent methyltransferase
MNKTSPEHSSFDPVWEELFRDNEWGKYPPEHVVRFVAQQFYRVPDRKQVRLLDVGSGPGACTWYMAREGFRVSAIDGSASAIRRLEARLGAEELEAETSVGDIVSLPWGDGTFDGVIDNAAIYCNRFENAKRIVREVHRVLKPGGAFCSASFSDRMWGYGTGEQVEPGGFLSLSEGPLLGRGFSLLMGRSQVDELFSCFEQKTVDRLSYTVGETNSVELWIVQARKAA